MTQGTFTRRGFVPHLPMRTGQGLDFDAPVKLQVIHSEGGSETHKVRVGEPLVCEGRYVHALPGGGEILGQLARWAQPLMTEHELQMAASEGEAS